MNLLQFHLCVFKAYYQFDMALTKTKTGIKTSWTDISFSYYEGHQVKLPC